MVMTTRAWSRTLTEKVYIAKLAVLISVPKIVKTHCWPLCAARASMEDASTPWTLQGWEWSLAKTAVAEALARSSRVIGMKAPSPHTTKTSAAKLYV